MSKIKANINKIQLLIFFYILSTGNLSADKLNFSIDDGLFLDSEGKFRWEFYYSFDENGLKYKLFDKGLIGELFVNVRIYSNIKLEIEKKWIVSHVIDKTKGNIDKSMVGQKDFILFPGQYRVNVFIQDVNDSTTSMETNFDLLVRNSNKDKLEISSFQLAQEIADSNGKLNPAFRKNDFYVVPNPSLVFIAEEQSLFSYLEIYKTNLLSELFDLEYQLLDSYRNIVELTKKELNGSEKTLKDTNRFVLSKLETGTYFLRATVKDSKDGSKEAIASEKKFYVVNTVLGSSSKERFYENVTYERSEFAGLNDEQTETEILKIKPISSFQEMEQFDKLTTTDAKKRLLFRFWITRDTDTNTVFNEALFKYRELINFANRYFSYSKTPGWQTDRGRVIMKYGMPSEREQHPFYGEERAYESWFYTDLQGGIYFHFVDMTGYGRYELVHSTAQNEIQFENWYDMYVLKKRTGFDGADEYNK